MRLALLGFGNVGQAFARLLESQKLVYPFRIVGVHTAHHGSAYSDRGVGAQPDFGPAAETVDEFLDRSRPEVLLELTTLNPQTGEPAISHIRKACERGVHVVTANKGPIAHAYADLRDAARACGVEFRFESTCMDGAPLFNMVRNNLPAVKILGFTGVLNSTSKVVIDAMKRGLTMAQGLDQAREMGIAEADPSYDIDGWDSSAKTAALANVLMDARVRPVDVRREGISHVTPEYVQALARDRKKLCLVSRAEQRNGSLQLSSCAEVLDDSELMAVAEGTSNILLLHTDLMGTLGTVSIAPTVDQTAYGVFSDVVDIAKTI